METTHATRAAVFARESFISAWDEGKPLIAANQLETGFGTDFSANMDFYVQLEDQKKAALYTMRHDGKLTGYQVFLFYAHPDYHNEWSAVQRTLYVTPEHRGIAVAHFMEFAHSELDREGVIHTFRQEREGGPKYSGLLERQGFTLAERVYVRTVKRGS